MPDRLPGAPRVIVGDALVALGSLEAGSVQCCVTSPPYFGLRDYGTGDWEGGEAGCDHLYKTGGTGASTLGAASGGNDMSDEARVRSTERSYVAYAGECRKCGATRVDRQIGLESTPDEYVANLVAVFREVKRVLRDDGTLWLNLGDSYAAAGGHTGQGVSSQRQGRANVDEQNRGPTRVPEGFKPKDLLGIPWMVAFALRADGWYLRSEIIWAKPNPMPESVTDRPTKAHEQVFLLSKSPRYFYDADAIREPQDTLGERHEGRSGYRDGHPSKNGGYVDLQRSLHPCGRNKRSVWTVATQPYPEAHFATFPAQLIEPMILAGCPREACGVCGAPWERQVEREAMVVAPTAKRAGWQASDDHARTQVGGTMLSPATSRTVGFASTCEHDDRTGRGVVLDPFAGSGTTLQVALANGRGAIGIELNPEYAKLIERRLAGVTPSMFDVA